MLKLLAFLLIFLLVLAACDKSSGTSSEIDEENIPIIVEPVHEQEPEPEQVGSKVCDFAEFPEKDFPRGQWTINQLTDKYGTPEEIYAIYLPIYECVSVGFIHQDIRIFLIPKKAELFSFYNEIPDKSKKNLTLEEKTFSLNEADKNMGFEVSSLMIFSNVPGFPRGIKIGESTKQDVIDAYSSESVEPVYLIDFLVIYSYGFRDENGELQDYCYGRYGNVSYFFDENEMLNSIEVNWFPGD